LAVTEGLAGIGCPGRRNCTEQLPVPEQFPDQPVNSVALWTTDCVRLTLVQPMKSKVHTPGQSIPGGMLVILPSLFSVTLETVTVEPEKLMTNDSGALATPPTLSETKVRIDLEP
jgi:hypothetical protein